MKLSINMEMVIKVEQWVQKERNCTYKVDQSSDHWITGWLLVLSCFGCISCGKIAASLAWKREASCSLTRLTVLYLVCSFVGLFFSWFGMITQPRIILSGEVEITYTSFHQTTVPSWVTLGIHRNSLRLRKEKEVKGRSKAKKEELRQVRLSSRRVWRRLRQA